VRTKTVARLGLLPAALLVGSVWAGSALAASGTAAQTHGSAGVNSAGAVGGVEGAAVLPFTGLSLLLFVIGGALLLTMGFGIRRLSQARD
jgi:hypothetical protein